MRILRAHTNDIVMVEWVFYPQSDRVAPLAASVVGVFEAHADDMSSATHDYPSNKVLGVVCQGLNGLGFRVECGQALDQKVPVPVLFGKNGKIEKAFHADAWNPDQGFVIEVEAGRAVDNNQFLKDLFQ